MATSPPSLAETDLTTVSDYYYADSAIIVELKERIAYLNGKVETQAAQILDLRKEKKDDKKEAADEICQLNKKLGALQHDCATLSQEFEEICCGKEEVSNPFFRLKDVLSSLSQERDALRDRNEESATENNDTFLVSKEEATAENSRLISEYQQLSDEVAALRKEHDALLSYNEDAKNKNCQLKGELAALREERDTQCTRNEEANNELAALRQAHDVLRRQNEESNNENRRLVDQHAAWKVLVNHNVFWKSSNDDIAEGKIQLDTIKCPALTAGVHKWSIRAEEGIPVGLGVVSTSHSFNPALWLGNQPGTWRYDMRTGFAYYNKSSVIGLPMSRVGSTVSLIMDLTGEGTLGVSIDGKPPFTIFRNMKSELTVPTGGFLPACALYSGTKVKFLGFE